MVDRNPTEKPNSVTEQFRKIMKESGNTKINTDKPYYSVNENKRNILDKVVSDLSQESLLEGLIYSEIFGQPKSKRRGR